jgi:uncharacterized protein with FMN-binding domain
MRKNTAAAVLGAAVLALPVAEAAGAATTATVKPKVKIVKKVTTKTYAGPAAEADRWGTVQVTIVVQQTATTTKTTIGTKTTSKTKVTRKISDVRSAYQVHTDRSEFIMQEALPLLKQETLTAQSANVQMISHATDTSEAFLQSLQAAVSQVA